MVCSSFIPKELSTGKLVLWKQALGCRDSCSGWVNHHAQVTEVVSVLLWCKVPHPGFPSRATTDTDLTTKEEIPISKPRGCDLILSFLSFSSPSRFPLSHFLLFLSLWHLTVAFSLCLLFVLARICMLSVFLGEGGGKFFLEPSNTPVKTYVPTSSHRTQDATCPLFLERISIQNLLYTIISQPSWVKANVLQCPFLEAHLNSFNIQIFKGLVI